MKISHEVPGTQATEHDICLVWAVNGEDRIGWGLCGGMVTITTQPGQRARNCHHTFFDLKEFLWNSLSSR